MCVLPMLFDVLGFARLGVLGNLVDDFDFLVAVAAGGEGVGAHGVAVPAQGAARRLGRLPGWEGVDRGILRRGVLHCSISLPRVGPSLDGSIPGRTHTVTYPPASPSMTVQLDSPQGNTAAQQSSVWSQPQSDQHSLFNPAVEGPREVATVDQARVDANGRREQATEIDGNANNTGTRELTRSSTGQPLFIDKLGSTAQVEITRERTAEPDPRSGQYSVLAD